MMVMHREPAKDTLLLLAVTSLEGIRSVSESYWFITVKVGGIPLLLRALIRYQSELLTLNRLGIR